jgi:TonB family protein
MTSLARLSPLLVVLLLGACALTGPQFGPPDLDTTSPAAPHCSPLSYPPAEQVAGNRGWVVVKATVQPDGSIHAPVVENSSGYAQLDASSLNSATRWCRFDAAAPGAAAGDRTVRLTFVWDFQARPGNVDIPVVRVGIQPGLQKAP